MLYTIYQVTNLINGKIYIGKHQTTNPDDGYYGSGIALKKSIAKHGKQNFKKDVLFVFETEEEMNAKETELITEEFVARSDTYNMGVGGEGGAHFKGKKHSDETVARITNTLSDPAVRKKISDALKGKVAPNKGIKDSAETCAKKKLAANTRVSSQLKLESRILISQSLMEYYKNTPKKDRPRKKRIRKPLSEETKEKIRIKARERKLAKQGCS